MEQIRLKIIGEPAPQGSKKIIHGRLIEASGAKLKNWRKAIEIACKNYQNQNIILGPVAVEVHFYLTRPASVKFNKRPLPIVPPDLDKLARGLLDGIGQSGAIWGDDSQVVKLNATKSYADENPSGAVVTITEIF
jgi:Holliday junction resolvase RusA-like endonuclease